MALAAVKYFGSNFEELNDSEQFLELLYHNDHNSYAFLNMKSADGTMLQKACLDKCAALSSIEPTCDTWVSLNLFQSSRSRAADNCRELTGFYFDMDKHDGSDKQIQRAVVKSIEVLNNLVNKKLIPTPTIVTRSGRGIGIYYVFNTSLAITSTTTKQQKLYTFLYSKLADILDHYFNSDDLLEVDRCVINDRSRIVRLPGTYNRSAGRYCSIYSYGTDFFGNVHYYDMSDFKEYVQTFDQMTLKETKKVIKHEASKMSLVSFAGCSSTFLFNRVNQMYKLQSNFNIECTDKRREHMCFIFYNSAKQIYSDAIDKLYAFNRNFVMPLDEKEIEHVIKSVDTNTTATHQGYYKLSDKWIISKLNLSQEELSVTMIGQSQRILERAAAKEKTKAKKQERKQISGECRE